MSIIQNCENPFQKVTFGKKMGIKKILITIFRKLWISEIKLQNEKNLSVHPVIDSDGEGRLANPQKPRKIGFKKGFFERYLLGFSKCHFVNWIFCHKYRVMIEISVFLCGVMRVKFSSNWIFLEKLDRKSFFLEFWIIYGSFWKILAKKL